MQFVSNGAFQSRIGFNVYRNFMESLRILIIYFQNWIILTQFRIRKAKIGILLASFYYNLEYIVRG